MNSIKVAFRSECANLLNLVNGSVKLCDLDSLHLMENPDENIPFRQRTTNAVQAKLCNILWLTQKDLNLLEEIQKDFQRLLLERRVR
jgi:hypothetical protein